MSHEETNEIDISIQPIVYDNASLDSLFTFIEDFEDFSPLIRQIELKNVNVISNDRIRLLLLDILRGEFPKRKGRKRKAHTKILFALAQYCEQYDLQSNGQMDAMFLEVSQAFPPLTPDGIKTIYYRNRRVISDMLDKLKSLKLQDE